MTIANAVGEQALGLALAPPNKGMQLTAKSVLSFAKRRAKARPLLSAADARG